MYYKRISVLFAHCIIFSLLFSTGCNDKKDSNLNSLLPFLLLRNNPLTVSISNIHNNSILRTGFIVGTASSSATLIEVSLDNGSYQPATGTEEWKFMLPSGVNTWMSGSHHSISVRAMDAKNKYSSVTELTVRKDQNHDINGDGYEDLVVSSVQYANSAANGAVYIFNGNPSGIEAATTAASAYRGITGNNAGDLFGQAITLGDVNGDGYGDLVVGASGYNSSQGRIYVFYGGENGISATCNQASLANRILGISGASNYDQFGYALATGDINGDGYDDVAVGAPGTTGYTSGRGTIYLFHGSASGFTADTAADANRTITGELSSDFLGRSLAVGDADGNGYADLAAGADGYSSGQYRGRAYLFTGSSSGIAITLAASADRIITGENDGDKLGQAVAFGDITGDGYADLVIGAPGTMDLTSSRGKVYVYHGSQAGIAITTADQIITGETTNGYFGTSISIGNLNGDGFSDLIAGAYGYSIGKGQVYIFNGSNLGITVTQASLANGKILGENNNDYTGWSVCKSDLNGDGYDDLTTGANGHSGGSNKGRVYIFNGSSSGEYATAAAMADTIISGEFDNDFFGYAVSQ